MIQGSYTPEAWAAQISNPSDRLAAVAEMLASTGITFEHYLYSFGDHDFVFIAEGASNVEAAAAVLLAFAGGAALKLKTTPLLTSDECIAALGKPGDAQYSARLNPESAWPVGLNEGGTRILEPPSLPSETYAGPTHTVSE